MLVARMLNQESDFSILNFICERERVLKVFDRTAALFR